MRNARLKKAGFLWVLIVALLLVVSACTTTRYVCTGTCALPVQQADSKCKSQTSGNGVYSDLRWHQCMGGEGYTRRKCKKGDKRPNNTTECQVYYPLSENP